MSFVCSLTGSNEKSTRKFRRAGFMALATLALAASSFAQSDTSTISGSVKDATGSSVPGAKVTVKNEGSGVVRESQTNVQGNYTVTSIPAGNYAVSVEANGFKKFTSTGNRLDASLPLSVDITLEVGQTSESVNITAEAQRIQTETATVGKVVDEYQIKNLMLNGRNPVLLAALKPGVRSSSSLANFNFNLTDGGFSMNGSRPNDNVFYTDGAVATRTRSNGTSIGSSDVDAVQEIQILTADYNAEYGRSGGGQVRVVTKSGGSVFHADAYEYFRNSAMDANTWARNNSSLAIQSAVQQPLHYNQFGYVVNGPVYVPGKFNTSKNKLFFLFSEEWVRYRTTPTNTATVPSDLMRQGNFSELLGPNIFFGKTYVVKDANGNPFPGNIIPQAQLSKNGLALINAYPRSTLGFLQGKANYIVSSPDIENQRKDTVSVDWVPTDKHTLRLRVQNFNYDIQNPFQGTFNLDPAVLHRPNQIGSLNYIWVISPRLINEALVSGSADHVQIKIIGNYSRSAAGVNYPYLYPASSKDVPDKLPTINVNGFTQLDLGPYPSNSGGPIYSYSDNVTWVKGNHTFKFGFLYERAGQNDRDQINVNGIPGGANNQAGRFDFQDTANGNPGIANAALGTFSTYAEIGPRSYTISRSNMYEMFAQDGWRLTPKLKLELGARYSIMEPYHALWANYDNFDARYYDPKQAVKVDPTTGLIVPNSGNIYNGIVIPGNSWPGVAAGRFPAAFDPQYNSLFKGLPNYYAPIQWGNIVPRIGVAYEVNEKTVIRSGFGGFKNKPAVSDATFLGGNAPFQGFISLSNGSVDNPGGAGGAANAPAFIQTQDPVYKIPTSYSWNFTVERQLPLNSILEVAYVGRVGLWLERIRDLNQVAPGTLQANPGVNINALRPYLGFSQIQIAENAARSTYNGLQVAWNRRFVKGLSYGVSYTYSKSYDNSSGRRDIPFNSLNDLNFWGPSTFDARHVAVINWIYELPYHNTKGFMGALVGGWSITGVTQFQTGTPFTIGNNTDYAGIGNGSFQPWTVNGSASLDSPQFSNSAADSNYYFKTKDANGNPIFTAPAAGTFSNQTKNLYNGPGFQNWNIAVFKTFRLGERQTLRFRAESFNWVNHPNWGGTSGSGQFGNPPSTQGQPDGNPTSSTFGKVTTKGGNRNMQLSLRYSF
jgi:Carboxypeptidase regulatory-like domain/TonB dependent receptor/TonB-dependent Receptor Plug Domain